MIKDIHTVLEAKTEILKLLTKFKQLGLVTSVDTSLLEKLMKSAFDRVFIDKEGNKVNPYEQNPNILVEIIPYWYLSEVGKEFTLDTECISEYRADYGDIITNLVRISDGVLTKMTYEIGGQWRESPTVKAVFNNRTYEVKLKFTYDYADAEGLIGFLNLVLKDTHEERRFYCLSVTKDQSANILFITEEQYTYLKTLFK